MQRSCWARTTYPPPCILRSPAHPAQAWKPIFSASCLTLWRSWLWNGLPLRNRPVAAWMNGSCRGTARPLFNELRHSSQRSTMRWPNIGVHPTRPHLRASFSSALTLVDGTEEKGYNSLPPLDESVAAYLCPPAAIGWKAKAAHGRSMASLVVFECHLWLNLTEMKDVDKVPFLDSPVSPTGLFGPAVEVFAERFTAAQTLSQAMRHFLPKRSSSAAASSHPKMAPTQQLAKAAPPAVQPAAKARAPPLTLSQTPPIEAPGTPALDSAGPSASGVFLIKGTGRGKG